MVQSLSMCLRPATPRSLTEPVSFGYIDPSRRVSRAELDRKDKLWREQQSRAISSTTVNVESRAQRRDSLESDMTLVNNRQNFYRPTSNTAPLHPRTATSSSVQEARNGRSGNMKSWLFPRKQQQTQAV